MLVLGLDIGSSSVKAAILRGTKIVGHVARENFPTQYSAQRAEVDPEKILHAIAGAIGALKRAKSVDVLTISTMSPSWIAMDSRGRAMTPVVTHQDRRSVSISRELIAKVGKPRLLRINGN